MKTVQHIIVGQGISGSLMAWFLMQHNQDFVVIDECKSMTSSKVAAGMFNPINGKRMVKNSNADLVIPFAIDTYTNLEKFFDCNFLHLLPIYNIMGSIKEQNDLTLKLDIVDFMKYIELNPVPFAHVKKPYGAFEIKNTGWLDVPKMLKRISDYLQSTQQLIISKFNYNNLSYSQHKWHYEGITSDTIIFCEGHNYHNNPFFSDIPYEPTKGDVLTIKCMGLAETHIIKKGIYLVPLGESNFKVGATYDRVNINEEIDPKAKQSILADLEQILELPFEIVDHRAGVRPTMRDRNPIARKHPTHNNLFILNGMGSKGVMFAPWFANILVRDVMGIQK